MVCWVYVWFIFAGGAAWWAVVKRERRARATGMGRQTTGRLFRRGQVWYMEWVVRGERFVRSLGPTSRTQAERIRGELSGPLRLRDRATMLGDIQATQDRIDQRRQEATRRQCRV